MKIFLKHFYICKGTRQKKRVENIFASPFDVSVRSLSIIDRHNMMLFHVQAKSSVC